MKLAAYLEEEQLTYAEFARRVESTRQSVERWAKGARIPRPEDMRRIAEATGGAVTPNDFFSVEAAE